MSSKASKVANLISSLGGPTVNLSNIARANDLETGNPLLTWLADQLGKFNDSLERATDDAHEKEEECERRTRAEMTELALEPEEVFMFVR